MTAPLPVVKPPIKPPASSKTPVVQAPKGPNPFEKAMQALGMVSSITTMAAMWGKLSPFLTKGLMGTSLGFVTGAVNSYSLYKSSSAFWKDPTKMGAFNMGMSAFGVAVGINTMLTTMGVIGTQVVSAFAANMAGVATGMAVTGTVSGTAAGASTSMFAMAIPIWGWAVAAGIILAPLVWGMINSKPPEEVALADLMKSIPPPTIWTAGPLLFAAAGVTALLMGWSPRGPAPAMDAITRPESYVVRKLGLKDTPSASAQPTVIVEQGKDGKPGQVMIISPQGKDARGVSQVRVDSFVLSDNLQFVSGPKPVNNYYIPFFVVRNGKAVSNPDVLKALTAQEGLLRAILTGSLTTQESINAMKLAGAANKYGGITPTIR